jgi:hypothetical protein
MLQKLLRNISINSVLSRLMTSSRHLARSISDGVVLAVARASRAALMRYREMHPGYR